MKRRRVENADDIQKLPDMLISFSKFVCRVKIYSVFFLTSSANMLKNSLTALSSFQESFIFILIAISFGNPNSLSFSVILLVLPQLLFF